jgi:hypothetical protein
MIPEDLDNIIRVLQEYCEMLIRRNDNLPNRQWKYGIDLAKYTEIQRIIRKIRDDINASENHYRDYD